MNWYSVPLLIVSLFLIGLISERTINQTKNTHKQNRRPQRNHKSMGTKTRRNPNQKRPNTTPQNRNRPQQNRTKPNSPTQHRSKTASTRRTARKSQMKNRINFTPAVLIPRATNKPKL